MHKLTLFCRSFFACLLLLVIISGLRVNASSLEQTSTGWLINPHHPAVSLQLQLTGQSDPATKTVNALLQVRLESDWKTYWRSPGDGGIAPHLDFTQSSNIADIVWHWPAPKRYSVLGVETLGYKGAVDFPLTLHLQDLAKPVLLKGGLTLASCTNICVLSDYDIELSFISDHLTINDEGYFLYNQAVASVPVKLDQSAVGDKNRRSLITALHTVWDNKKQQLVVQIENKAPWQTPDLFVDSSKADLSGITFSAPKISISGHIMTAQIPASSGAGKLDLQNTQLNLTVVDKALALELLSQVKTESESRTLLSMFMIALLGGLILNIMPCVLPVLGMKLSSILSVQRVNQRQQIRKQFIASSLGILSSFWLLAVFLLILKLSGQAIGWGIQFQSPYFISLMVVITALFAANMFGIFSIQLPVNVQTWLATRGSQSYLGYYLQGMFATLLATPCSAPFLGTAVAFSLAASVLQLFIIFTALGVGMALPWLLIALFPAIAQYLPKPGRWMNVLRTFFALLILLSCYWLLSLLTAFIGAFSTLLIALSLTALLLFLMVRKGDKKLVVVILCAMALLIGRALIADEGHRDLLWQPLNRSVIEQQVKQGKVVFVDITADWCITCKANKIGVLQQDPVHSRLQGEDMLLMKGDWTKASAEITKYLQSYGRFGVPFNMVYGPSAPQGIPLATLLTSESVLTAIKQAR